MAEFEKNFKEPQATHHFKRTYAQTIQERNNKEGTMYKNINAAIEKAIKKVIDEKQKKDIIAIANNKAYLASFNAKEAESARRENERQYNHVQRANPSATPQQIKEIMRNTAQETKRRNELALAQAKSKALSDAMFNRSGEFSSSEGNYMTMGSNSEGGKLKSSKHSSKRSSRKHLSSKRSSKHLSSKHLSSKHLSKRKRKVTRKFRR